METHGHKIALAKVYLAQKLKVPLTCAPREIAFGLRFDFPEDSTSDYLDAVVTEAQHLATRENVEIVAVTVERDPIALFNWDTKQAIHRMCICMGFATPEEST